MNIKKLIEKLENDLGHFLIAELCKSDPSKRSGGELYKYKGLSITIKTERKDQDKIISIRIGVFEADFKVETCEKVNGSLSPQEEDLIKIWMSKGEKQRELKALFKQNENKREVKIIPIDLENFFEDD